MKILVVTPVAREFNSFVRCCTEQGTRAETVMAGRLPVTHFRALELGVAQGGLGKAQFAVQTQHLIHQCPDVRAVVCAGAAGALSDQVRVGDVVVATETIEHDIRNRFGPPQMPRFRGASPVIAALRELSQVDKRFQVHFGPVASGDEDVVDTERRQAIQQMTCALAVAWEGAGGARACQFNEVPFVEIRGITDGADGAAASDFRTNVHLALGNVAALITAWAKDFREP